MNPEGQILIEMEAHSGQCNAVSIRSTRPVLASRIMIGKHPEQALSIFPLLFSVCGVAQARASICAIQQQLDITTQPTDEHARDLLLLGETAREHMLRLLIDWPELFDYPRNNRLLPFVAGLLQDLRQTLFQDGNAFMLDSVLQLDAPRLTDLIDQLERHLATTIFQQPLPEWLAMESLSDIQRWVQHSDSIAAHSIAMILKNRWGDQGACASEALPPLDASALYQQFSSAQARNFIAQPDWHGNLHETTSLSRQQSHTLISALTGEHGNGLITRWMARLVELAGIPAQMRTRLLKIENHSGDRIGSNEAAPLGIAQVEAARGRLIHRVVIDQQRISEYQILAPTEWNFHPRGLIQQSLANIRATDQQQLRHLSRLMINAIDPCVGYDLRLH